MAATRPIQYRAEHTGRRWRSASHTALEDKAINGPNGAVALLLHKPELASRWRDYGPPVFVCAWSEQTGYVLRLNPGNPLDVQIVRVDSGELTRRDRAAKLKKTSGYTEDEVNRLFVDYSGPCIPLVP